MELLSNINKIAFFSWLFKMSRFFICPRFILGWVFFFLSSLPAMTALHEVSSGRAVGELSGTGVVVVLRLPEAGVGVHGEVGFLQVGRGLVAILGNYGTLLLPVHFLVDDNRRL